MRRGIVLLLWALLAAPGCTWETGRAWQRHECLRQPGQDAQQRCADARRDGSPAPVRLGPARS